MKITSLKIKSCAAAALTLALATTAYADDRKQNQPGQTQSQQQLNKDRTGQSQAAYGNKAAVGAPMPSNKASNLLGMAVHDQNGEKLGDIKDLALDVNSGRVAYTVFGTDGKERLFAIPPHAYQIGANHKHLVLNIDKAKYEAAKGFQDNQWPSLNSGFQGDAFWTTSGRSASAEAGIEVGAVGAEAEVEADVSLSQESPATTDAADAAESQEDFAQAEQSDASESGEELSATGKESSFRGGQVTDINKASKLLGMNIKNQQGEDLGEIKDMVIDLKTGKVSYVVLGYGGILGIGEKMVGVPITAFQVGATADVQASLVLNASKEKLEMATGFEENNWPSVSNPTWGADKFWEDRSGATGQQNQQDRFQNRNPNSPDQNRANPQQ